MKILVTGAAGFIGFHLATRLLHDGHEVVGLDIINDYYDVRLKYGRLAQQGIPKTAITYGQLIPSATQKNYQFIQLNLSDNEGLQALFSTQKFEKVCNLAAQAGVRYSLENPMAYMESNIVGFCNILENCRHHQIQHLVYASSSSVYGLNEKLPFSTSDNVDHPISLYAASKKSNELMAHTYSHLFGLPTTGLRFFTVYGPWGRPDMALFLFTKAILEDRPIQVFNRGDMKRDFTYMDDIVEGITRILQKSPEPNPDWQGSAPNPSSSVAPYKVYNIGNSSPVALMDFISEIEIKLGKVAQKEFLPIQQGDVKATWADTTDLARDTGYRPATTIRAGVSAFVDWYLDFYTNEKS